MKTKSNFKRGIEILNKIEDEVKINLICCDEKMCFSANYFNGEDYQSWTCLKCGCFKTLIMGTLDDEELNNIKEIEGALK